MFTSLRGKFIFIFILITVSTVMISSGYARYQHRRFVMDRLKERAIVDLELISADIRSLQQWIQRDLLVLRDLPDLQALLNSQNVADESYLFHIVERQFLNIAAHHQIFQQLRLLSVSGKEIIRANSNGSKLWLTPERELQDKSDRYYFQEASLLRDGEISISPMDLNIEQGQLQIPLTPVIRYSTPLFDHQKRKKGILVLNVFGSVFLNLLDRQQKQVRGGENYYLLNKDGYFLYHPDIQKRFGFMLGHNETVVKDEPLIAAWLGTKERGTQLKDSAVTGKKTLYAYIRIPLTYPIQPDFPENFGDNRSNSYWILLTTVDDANLLLGLNEYVQSFLKFTLLLTALCVVVAVFVSWRFSRPILSLARAASKIHQGDLSSRARIYSQDDMGKFGNLFNKMAENLEKSMGNLQRSEAKYRLLFENSQDCIFVTDKEFRIVELNQAGRNLFALGENKLPGDLFLFDLGVAEKQGEQADVIRQLAAGEAIRDVEIAIVRRDGSQRYCIMTATARKGEHGMLSGLEGVLRDVTELREQQRKEQQIDRRIREEIVFAQERERRHMGQVLHEEMAQNLALVNLRLQEAEQQSCRRHNGPEEVPSCIHDELLETRNMVQVMIDQIRTMIFDLFPRVLDDQGLGAAMAWYGRNFSRKTGVNVSVYGGESELGLSKSQNIFLFRAYKELLHNAWKHAETAEIVATIKRRDEFVRMTVDDEGRGFDPQQTDMMADEFQGIGLVTIRQWLDSMDGRMTIESEMGKGCRVILDVPIKKKENGSDECFSG